MAAQVLVQLAGSDQIEEIYALDSFEVEYVTEDGPGHLDEWRTRGW